MKIFFLRHTDASYSNDGKDEHRILSPRGELEAKTIGTAIQAMRLNFSEILCSPFYRAQQTAEIALPGKKITTSNLIIPDSPPKPLLTELRHFSDDSSILIVSHQPFIGNCVSTMVGGKCDIHLVIGKGSMALVEIGTTMHPGSGMLHWLIHQEQMLCMK